MGNLPKGELSYVRIIAEDPNCARATLRRNRQRACTTRLTMAASGLTLQGGLPHLAGELGRGAEAVSRPGGLDVWSRALHPRRHHASGADGEEPFRRVGRSLRTSARVPVHPGRPGDAELLAQDEAKERG